MVTSFQHILKFKICRLWRIGEIVNGTVIAIEQENTIRIEQFKERIRILEVENMLLKELMPGETSVGNFEEKPKSLSEENGSLKEQIPLDKMV